jgi:hypothetical protein
MYGKTVGAAGTAGLALPTTGLNVMGLLVTAVVLLFVGLTLGRLAPRFSRKG